MTEGGDSRGKDPEGGPSATEVEELEEPLGGTSGGDDQSDRPGGNGTGGKVDLVDGGGTNILSASPAQVREWQLADSTLSHVRELADGKMMVDKDNPAQFHY